MTETRRIATTSRGRGGPISHHGKSVVATHPRLKSYKENAPLRVSVRRFCNGKLPKASANIPPIYYYVYYIAYNSIGLL